MKFSELTPEEQAKVRSLYEDDDRPEDEILDELETLPEHVREAAREAIFGGLMLPEPTEEELAIALN